MTDEAIRHLGIDIGGTKIGVCVGDDRGTILARAQIETNPDSRPEALLTEAWRLLERQLSEVGGRAAAVGVPCPGPMSSHEGRLLDPPNMAAWHGFEVRRFVEKLSGLPTAIMNDANASVLAEVWLGAARGAQSAVFLTMSTGMGAGLYLGSDVYEGPDDLAGEVGHLRLDTTGPVGFGKIGSVEGTLSGPGMTQVVRSEILAAHQRGEPSPLLDAVTVGPREMCEAAVQGDSVALRAIDRIGDALGRLIAILTDLLNPEVVVLGTIGAAHPDLFIPRARAVVAREAITRSASRLRIEPSPLGIDRGDLAALAIARRLLRS